MNKSAYHFFGLALILSAGLFFLYDGIMARVSLPVYGDEDHFIEEFSFTDQNGSSFNSEDYKDKIWVVHSFFTSCPTICPEMMKTMQNVHNLVRNDSEVMLLSISIDPKHDTPERLLMYSDRWNMDPTQWKLLTGEKKMTYRLLRNSFLQGATDVGSDDGFIHSENIVLVDSNGKIRDIIPGTDKGASTAIVKSIKRLEKEEKNEK